MDVHYEVTDTFGGEANYSWVNRDTERVPDSTSNLALVRRLKQRMGISGQRAEVSNYGDTIEVRPVGRGAPCIVGFITF